MLLSVRVLAAPLLVALALLLVLPTHLVGAAGAQPTTDAEDGPASLHLVTFAGPGTVREPGREAAQVRQEQDAVLGSVDAPAPRYRWTTVLDGVAVDLTPRQVAWLREDERVAQIEADSTHTVAGTGGVGSAVLPAAAPSSPGGAGTVVGFVDTGLWPDHEVFGDDFRLGARPHDFSGACTTTTPGWPTDVCGGKILAARWFVEGFGADRLHPDESLSARDVVGHGTAVASAAVGNAGLTLPGRVARRPFSGVAPHARAAAYKACWRAAEPDQDGCSTSDLVAAVEQAVRDGVDVLSLAVGVTPGTTPVSALDLALLGATEAGVVVVAAAGGRDRQGYAGYATPWVTTVGATSIAPRRARVAVAGGPTLVGTGRAGLGVASAPLLLGSRAPTTGRSARAARQCRTGSLDPRRVRGTVVVCRRGGTARTEKSQVVARAGGAGMVLVDEQEGRATADVHAVPTVHLDVRSAEVLLRHLRRHRGVRAELGAEPSVRPRRIPNWSAAGDPGGALVKPDLVAPGARVLTAVAAPRGRWSTLSGTSAATARVAGLAAQVRSRHPRWDVARVHSALRTSTRKVEDGSSPLRQGAGTARAARALSPGLAFDLDRSEYRRWLDRRVASRDLNVPALLTRAHGTFTRRVTNVGGRSMYYSSSVTGFRHSDVRVEPAALRLDPGESATFRIIVAPPDGAHLSDHGAVVWRGAQGTTVRMPVVLTR